MCIYIYIYIVLDSSLLGSGLCRVLSDWIIFKAVHLNNDSKCAKAPVVKL